MVMVFLLYTDKSQRDEVSYMFPLNALVTFCKQTGSRDGLFFHVRLLYMVSNNSLHRLFSFGQSQAGDWQPYWPTHNSKSRDEGMIPNQQQSVEQDDWEIDTVRFFYSPFSRV